MPLNTTADLRALASVVRGIGGAFRIALCDPTLIEALALLCNMVYGVECQLYELTFIKPHSSQSRESYKDKKIKLAKIKKNHYINRYERVNYD